MMTRRHLLQSAAVAITSRRLAAAELTASPLMTTLSTYMAEAANKPLRAASQQSSKCCTKKRGV